MPETVGGYEFVRRIGTGGMAEVFEARRVGFGGFQQRVALKCILQELATDEAFVRQFIHEARLGSQLQHPNIIAVQDFNQVDGVLYLAMEYVDGVDLYSLIRHEAAQARGFPPALAAFIMSQVLEGLGFAHACTDAQGQRLRVIHRDIKPPNLLLTRQGVVKIADFGIAKASSSYYQAQTGGMVKGSYAYMSPEQLAGRPLTPASDLFAVGVILYELLMLKRLFVGEPITELLQKISAVAVADELEALRQAHPTFYPIVSRALAKEPEARFADAGEFLEALRPLFDPVECRARCVERVEELLEARAARAASDAGAQRRPLGPGSRSNPSLPSGPSRRRDESVQDHLTWFLVGEAASDPGVRPIPPRAWVSEGASPPSWWTRWGLPVLSGVIGLAVGIGGLTYALHAGQDQGAPPQTTALKTAAPSSTALKSAAPSSTTPDATIAR